MRAATRRSVGNQQRYWLTTALAMTALRFASRAFLIAATAMTFGLAMPGCGDDDGVDPQAPVLAPIGNHTVVLGSDLLLAVSASDPQGDPVILSASGLPDNSYFLPDSGIFCILANDEDQLDEPVQVIFTASDGYVTTSETVTITIVRPDAAQLDALGAMEDFTLAPIGNQSVLAGDTLSLQLSAEGASSIVYKMFPEPALAPLVTLDQNTGAFSFSPTAAQAGEQYEVTFQACVPNGTGCDAIMQLHETVYLAVESPQDCTAGLPVPTPIPPAHRVVQLVNCTNQQLLGAANAAYKSGQPPFAVLPREGTWVMEKLGTAGNRNVLTIDIPPEWEDTKCGPSGCPEGQNPLGPRFWARTGCHYDIASDRAQCETGDCGNKYDCSKAHLAAATGTTIAEWTFYEPVSDQGISYFKESPDISAVDGVNLNMDIQPLGGDATNPFDRLGGQPDKYWLNTNYPLVKHGQDLRANDKCQPANFQVKRSELSFVQLGNDGKPVGGDHTIACLSNCGRYAYPLVPQGPGGIGLNCDPSDPTSQCYRWKVFCCPLGVQAYDQLCDNPPNEMRPDDALCNVTPPVPPAMGDIPPYEHGAFLGACWFRGTTTDRQPKDRCSCRAFIRGEDCPSDVCTHPFKDEPGAQPPFGHCRDVSSDSNACIGDDTFHRVMPKAYSWPNDPQVYGANAPAYRVILAPGGTDVPVSESGPIPLCSKMSANADYQYEQNQAVCAAVAPGATFGGARISPKCRRFCTTDTSRSSCTVDSECPNHGHCTSDCVFGGCDVNTLRCNAWECDLLGQSNAVMCRWDTGPTPTATPGMPTPTPVPLSCDGLSGQRLRLDADRITGLGAGAAVASWSDLSGSGNDVSQSNAIFRPTWQPSTWNGHATVRFGANDPSALTRGASIVTGSSARSIIVVASRTAGGAGQAYVDLGATSAGDGAAYIFSPEHSARFQRGNVTWSSSAPIGAPQIVSVVQSGTDTASIALYQNGAVQQRSGGLAVPLNTAGGTTVGHQTTGDFSNAYWALRGDIGTVLVFDRALSPSERCMCEQDLGRKYGVTVSCGGG